MSDSLPWFKTDGSDAPSFTAFEFETMKEEVSRLGAELSIAGSNNELLLEELNGVVGRMADASASNWLEMTTGASETGLQLHVLKVIAQRLRDMTETNPLLKRGHQLRRDYVYARGIDLGDNPERVRKALNDPFNKELVFSQEGFDTLMRSRYTDGNRFYLVHKHDKSTVAVPMDQITNSITDPMDPSRIKYIARTFNGKETWFATDLWDATGKAKARVKVGQQGEKSVNRDYVMVHKAFNRPVGATWGLPDALPAYLWVLAYSAYLKDNAALVKAYSAIALKVSAATKRGAQNAEVSFANTPGVAATATMGSGVDVTAMPTSGSQVNFNNGRPLAAMVATSLGVSIVALLSDPGTGGSYGVAETLDPPTLLLAQTLQTTEAEYFGRLLRLYGAVADKIEVSFPSIDKDPAYRTLQAIYQAVAQGLLSRKEARPLIAILLDMSELKPGDLPEPDGFNNYTDPDPEEPTDDDAQNDPTPRQGNRGAAGSATQGDTNNDLRTDNE